MHCCRMMYLLVLLGLTSEDAILQYLRSLERTLYMNSTTAPVLWSDHRDAVSNVSLLFVSVGRSEHGLLETSLTTSLALGLRAAGYNKNWT